MNLSLPESRTEPTKIVSPGFSYNRLVSGSNKDNILQILIEGYNVRSGKSILA